MSYPILDVSGWPAETDEQMGSKPKSWLYDPSDKQRQQRWLFKENWRRQPEDWSEKIAAEVADLLGVPHAQVELAGRAGKTGVISRSFVTAGSGLELSSGNELIKRHVDPSYVQQPETRFRSGQHTLDRILSVVGQDFVDMPDCATLPPQIKTATGVFVGYLMFDALIGNKDRHHENWGLLKRNIRNGRGMKAELAPTFDHASSLGCELLDDERTSRLNTRDSGYQVSAYDRKNKSRIFERPQDTRPLHPLQTFQIAAGRYPDDGRAWLRRLSTITEASLVHIVDLMPDQRMTQPTRLFAKALLRLHRDDLLVSEI